MIRRYTFSSTFNSSQMLARTELLQVPQISQASKAGMWFEHAFFSLATHLRAKKHTTVVETGHCPLLSLSAPYPIHKSLRGQSQNEKRHCKVILFLPLLSLFPVSSPSLLALHRHTLKASSARNRKCSVWWCAFPC